MSPNSTLTAGHGPSPEHLQGQVGVTPTPAPPQALPAQLGQLLPVVEVALWLAGLASVSALDPLWAGSHPSPTLRFW